MVTPPTSAPSTPKLHKKSSNKRHSSPSHIIQQSSYSISDDLDDDMDSDTVSIGGVETNITYPVIDTVIENIRSSSSSDASVSSSNHHHQNNYHHGSSSRPSRRSTPVLDESERDDRPYKCKVPGCIKSYKNPGGLKVCILYSGGRLLCGRIQANSEWMIHFTYPSSITCNMVMRRILAIRNSITLFTSHTNVQLLNVLRDIRI